MVNFIITSFGIVSLIGITGGVIIGVKYFNLFHTLKQHIEYLGSNLKTEYQRKIDLIRNLRVAVNSYTDFEKGTYDQVTKSRGLKFEDIIKDIVSEGQTQGSKFKDSLGINAVSERYPNLKASKEYIKLIEQLELTEDRINISRKDLNKVTNKFNTLIKVFPSNIFASVLGFRFIGYYEMDEKEVS